jgi:hypothetical protein
MIWSIRGKIIYDRATSNVSTVHSIDEKVFSERVGIIKLIVSTEYHSSTVAQ